jgi:hypothetical protein
MHPIFWQLFCTSIHKSPIENNAASESGNSLYATMMQVCSWDSIAITVTHKVLYPPKK